jgi:hypothetical protein
MNLHNSGASCRENAKLYPPSFYDMQLHIVVRADARANALSLTAASASRPAFRFRKRLHRKRTVRLQNISRHETRGGVALRGAAYRRGFPATGARRPHRVGCLTPSATPGQRDRGHCCAGRIKPSEQIMSGGCVGEAATATTALGVKAFGVKALGVTSRHSTLSPRGSSRCRIT